MIKKFSTYEKLNSDTILVDGTERSRYNSNGKLIYSTDKGIINFWKWFGDSKVVDDKGRPLIVYHGTINEFDNFSRKNIKNIRTKGGKTIKGEWHVFTDNTELASNYAGVKRNDVYDKDSTLAKTDGWWSYPRDKKIGSVIPVYLKITNPLITDAKDGVYYDFEKLSVNKAKHDGNDGVIINNIWDIPGTNGSLSSYKHNEYITFIPTQIKSAIGNQGTFDLNSNVIYENSK